MAKIETKGEGGLLRGRGIFRKNMIHLVGEKNIIAQLMLISFA